MQSFDEASAKSWHGSKETILRKKSLELFQGLFVLWGPKAFDAKLAKLKGLEILCKGLFLLIRVSSRPGWHLAVMWPYMALFFRGGSYLFICSG